MIEIILFAPLILAAAVFLLNKKIISNASMCIYAVLLLSSSIQLYIKPDSFTSYFRTDDLNIIFLLILALLFAGVSLYNISYMKHENVSEKRKSYYTINILLFTASVAGVVLSSHLAMLWVFIEATTLSSAYLIYFHRTPTAIEATWKYLFICSVGIALAFVGITLLSMGLGGFDSLYFDELGNKAGSIDPFWLKLSFPFILAGFGTKAGLAPVHAWLPDAHSESPSPVSAILSGTLLNAALLGILRVVRVMDLAEMGDYARTLLLATGFLSLFVTAVYIGVVKNYKRMLAYSSIENMGIIAIGVGIGGAGLFAAVFHLTAHSLTKASFFLTSGNILHRYGTAEIAPVRGLLKGDSATGWLWIFTFAAIIGLPPFPIFISEYLIIKAMFAEGRYGIAFLFFLLLTIIMAGMAKNVLRMCFGEDSAAPGSGKAKILEWLPQLIFMLLLLTAGLCLPDAVRAAFEAAASIL